jgi:hypothetical protein
MIGELISGGSQILGGVVGGIMKNNAAKREYARGRRMYRKGSKQANTLLDNRPEYKIPEEVQASLNLAQNELGSSALQSGLQTQADRQLANNVSVINRSATSGADALAALNKAVGQSQEGYNNAAIAGAQERQSDLSNLYNAQSQMGDYHGIQYDQNVNLPFLQRMELAQGKIGAGLSRMGSTGQARLDSAGLFGNAIGATGDLVGSLFKK